MRRGLGWRKARRGFKAQSKLEDEIMTVSEENWRLPQLSIIGDLTNALSLAGLN